jgi:hypothetical protein
MVSREAPTAIGSRQTRRPLDPGWRRPLAISAMDSGMTETIVEAHQSRSVSVSRPPYGQSATFCASRNTRPMVALGAEAPLEMALK